MTDQPPARPFYLRTDAEPVFGLLHPARPDIRSGTGVLIVGPWGWDDVATYRSRREWAERLAGLGHEALRIDLPGAGDSGNSASDAQRVEAWTAAVIAAATSLRDLEGCGRVAVIGMGLGGLIAGQAICEGGPIHDLVLWAAPATGRAFLREARAFAGLQTSRFTGPSLLPDGWMEVGGFVLTAETIEALGSLALAAIPGGVLRRALLLERDSAPVDDSLRLHLQREGVSVEVAPGDGWESMCFDIEKYQPPVEVFSTVAGWLASSPMESPAVGTMSGVGVGMALPYVALAWHPQFERFGGGLTPPHARLTAS
jgi:pimeloyl-ACP methyl ester carboxylesterase